jgi:GST-like protein
LIVYGMNSPNVTKVVIMLEELKLEYELRHVAVFAGEQFTPEFLAMNPLGKVPVLVDSALARPLAESGAILFWLAERSGHLLPGQGPARYQVMQWFMVQMSTLGPMLGQLNHFRLLPKDSEPYAQGRYFS